MKKLLVRLILNNVRSLYNVGAIFRVADGAGIAKIYLTGLTGYPAQPHDPRQPWEIERCQQQIHKTALGAEESVAWEQADDIFSILNRLRQQKVALAALENTARSTNLFTTPINFPAALIVGHEKQGVDDQVLDAVDQVVCVPMRGTNHSLNVAIATAIAVYELQRRQSQI